MEKEPKYVPSLEEVKKTGEERMSSEQKKMSEEREGTFKAGYREAKTFESLKKVLETKVGKPLRIDLGSDDAVGKLVQLHHTRFVLSDLWDETKQYEYKYEDIYSVSELKPKVRDLESVYGWAEKYSEEPIWKTPDAKS